MSDTIFLHRFFLLNRDTGFHVIAEYLNGICGKNEPRGRREVTAVHPFEYERRGTKKCRKIVKWQNTANKMEIFIWKLS